MKNNFVFLTDSGTVIPQFSDFTYWLREIKHGTVESFRSKNPGLLELIDQNCPTVEAQKHLCFSLVRVPSLADLRKESALRVLKTYMFDTLFFNHDDSDFVWKLQAAYKELRSNCKRHDTKWMHGCHFNPDFRHWNPVPVAVQSSEIEQIAST